MRSEVVCRVLSLTLPYNKTLKINFKSIEHKFKAIICDVKHLYKYNTPNHKLKDIFICQEHEDIADMVLQAERDIILTSRQSHFKNMSKYLKLLQPAILDNLTRMRGGVVKKILNSMAGFIALLL